MKKLLISLFILSLPQIAAASYSCVATYTCAAGKRWSNSQASCVPCDAGSACPGTTGTITDGVASASSGTTQCGPGTWSGAGASACSTCPPLTTGFAYDTQVGMIAVTQCTQIRSATAISSFCNEGVLRQTATNATTWGAFDQKVAIKAKAGASLTGSAGTISCAQCAGATYTDAVNVKTACDACNSNYTYDTTAGKTAATQCKTNCAAGKYVAAANAACTDIPVAGWRAAAETTNQGSTGSFTSCPANYQSGSLLGKTAEAQCQMSCVAATGTNGTITAAAALVNYNNVCQFNYECSTGYYDAAHGTSGTANALACANCTNAPAKATGWTYIAGAASIAACPINITHCNAGYNAANNGAANATCVGEFGLYMNGQRVDALYMNGVEIIQAYIGGKMVFDK